MWHWLSAMHLQSMVTMCEYIRGPSRRYCPVLMREQVVVCSQAIYHTMCVIADLPGCKLSSAKYGQAELDPKEENVSIACIDQKF